MRRDLDVCVCASLVILVLRISIPVTYWSKFVEVKYVFYPFNFSDLYAFLVCRSYAVI